MAFLYELLRRPGALRQFAELPAIDCSLYRSILLFSTQVEDAWIIYRVANDWHNSLLGNVLRRVGWLGGIA
jgi:hypothetical protein